MDLSKCVDDHNCTLRRHTLPMEDVTVAVAAHMELHRDVSFSEAFWEVTQYARHHGVDLDGQFDAVTWHESIVKRQVRSLLADYGYKFNPWD